MAGPRHVKTLEVEAKTRTERDPKTYTHKVTLSLDDDWKWVLHVEDTPGSWFVETLLLGYPAPKVLPASIRVPEMMWIDYGQRWYVENWREVFAAALSEI